MAGMGARHSQVHVTKSIGVAWLAATRHGQCIAHSDMLAAMLMCRLTGQPAYSSYLTNSLVMRGHSAAVRTLASSITPALSTGVLVKGNVLVESYDTSTVSIGGHHGLVNSNLALGTIKDMTGEPGADSSLLKPVTDSWQRQCGH